jgi:hypothetical protein
LPVRLTLELAERWRSRPAAHRHGGLPWRRRVLDPLLRRYFSAEFAAAMDEHARTEFPLLRDHLAQDSPHILIRARDR